MSLFSSIVIAIVLLILISIASEFLALGSEILELKFGPSFVGSVILGFITMLPELLFVLIAIYANEPDVAVGSAVGGNILLFTIGYGLVILVAYVKHKEIITLKPTMRDDLWYLIIATFYLLVASIDRKLTLVDGIILTLLYFVFVTHQYIESKRIDQNSHEEKKITQKQWLKSGLFMFLGAITIILCAEPFVKDIVELSNILGISPVILALIISPIASEMPEKISAFVLANKSLTGAEIAIANFVGSKVQASTLLFGSMIILYVFLPNSQNSLNISHTILQIFLAVFTTIIGVVITYDLKLKLKEGWFVFFLYIGSLIAVFYFS